ncbi:MAG: DUF2330 domain-containing protein [Gemmataceae bacterium]|nr:DUF2330 domain-containing protein [Gemmataceae bacterium]
MRGSTAARFALLGMALLAFAPFAQAMCGYFSRPIISNIKQPAVLQPSQIAFITWDPMTQTETVTVQPRFEGSAEDFGMVIPTPSQPKLHEMPRDFFKALGLVTQPKRRAFAESKLMPQMFQRFGGERAMPAMAGGAKNVAPEPERPNTVTVLEVGQVGNLDYKIIKAGRADDLFQWLKDNKYSFSGDEATLNFYVQKNYVFTVMKIDTLQMKRNKDGTFTGDITPTRFTFNSEKLVYPLKITQVSVKDKTDAMFYVQAPYKVDLSGDFTYQYHWASTLQQVAQTIGENDLIEPNRKWLRTAQQAQAQLFGRPNTLGFSFPLGQEPPANNKGHMPSRLEWAKRLTADDIAILSGDQPYSEAIPDPDFGFTRQDLNDPRRAAAVMKVIQHRLAKYRQDRPRGYLVREGPKEDLKTLGVLKGHLQQGQMLTKFYHTFTRDEMNDDLVLTQAKIGDAEDTSEHEELLRTVTFGGGRGRPFGGLPVRPDLPVPPIPGRIE